MKVIGLSKEDIDDLSLTDINGYMEVMDRQMPKQKPKKLEKNQVASEQNLDWGWTRRGKRS